MRGTDILEDGHDGGADDNNDEESTFSLPWARMCCACAAIMNSPSRLIIAAQAAANRAALLQRVRNDHNILNPQTAFTPTIMRCGPHTGNLLFHKQARSPFRPCLTNVSARVLILWQM